MAPYPHSAALAMRATLCNVDACSTLFANYMFAVDNVVFEWQRAARRLYESIFSPTMEMMSVVMKNSRQKVAGSWKTKMPNRTVPTAPMPVHTG